MAGPYTLWAAARCSRPEEAFCPPLNLVKCGKARGGSSVTSEAAALQQGGECLVEQLETHTHASFVCGHDCCTSLLRLPCRQPPSPPLQAALSSPDGRDTVRQTTGLMCCSSRASQRRSSPSTVEAARCGAKQRSGCPVMAVRAAACRNTGGVLAADPSGAATLVARKAGRPHPRRWSSRSA